MEVQELRPGLWRWTADHPEWNHAENWGPEVASVYAELPDAVAVLTAVVVQTEETHVAGREELLVEYPAEVIADLVRVGALVETRVGSRLVDLVVAERSGADPIDRRRLVEPDERIRVEPVSARPVPPVHEHHPRVRSGEQGIRERHGRRSAAHHQIVGVDL